MKPSTLINSRLLSGPSCFSYPHWGKGVFYPQVLKATDWLTYYSRFFNTVELNTIFYRLPSKPMLANWRASAPSDFILAVKASRYITHLKRLKVPKESTTHFLDLISMLQNKLGPVLFQLSPSLSLSLELDGTSINPGSSGYGALHRS